MRAVTPGAPSAATLGADPEALDSFIRAARSASVELSTRAPWDPARIGAGWTGPDGDRLVRELHTVAVQRRRAADVLAVCADVAARAAISQRRASLSAPAVAVPVDRRSDGGRLVQRVGAPDASVVVVLVPGVGTDPGDRRRLRSDAARLWGRLTDRVDDPDRVAVVSWLGYDPPDRVPGALDVRPAQEGSRSLVDDVARIRADGAATVVVVGHSYGGVVAGLAALAGLDADVVVQLGSPGSGAPGAATAIARRGVELRAVRESGDPIGFVAGRLPGLYGEDPVGYVPTLPTSRSGHSAYLADPVLLDALAELAVRYRRAPWEPP